MLTKKKTQNEKRRRVIERNASIKQIKVRIIYTGSVIARGRVCHFGKVKNFRELHYGPHLFKLCHQHF